MHIDDHRQPDGSYLADDGCWYENARSYIMGAILGWCECGMPWEGLAYLRGHLQRIADHTEANHRLWDHPLGSPAPHPLDPMMQAANRANLAALHGTTTSDGERYFAWYVLDALDLTTHGGSVPGWLTEKGHHLLEDLRELALHEPVDEGDEVTDGD